MAPETGNLANTLSHKVWVSNDKGNYFLNGSGIFIVQQGTGFY